jgi:uncharacterized protein (DUF885 family)
VSEPAALRSLLMSYLDLRWHLDPVDGSAAGLAEHDTRLGSFAAESVAQHVAALRALMGAVEELPLDDLQDEIDRTALLNDVRMAVHRLQRERPHVRDPGHWVAHALEGLHQMLLLRDRPADARARAAVARLRALPGFLDEARATLADCPVVHVETALHMVQAGLPLVDQLAEAFPDGADLELAAACGAARDGFAAFAAHLAGPLRERAASDGFAVGEDAFNFRLHFQHAVQATATELLRYGARLVEEVERDVVTLAAAITPGAHWLDVLDRLRDDHPTAEGLVDAYAGEMQRARAFVEQRGLVPLPDGQLAVVATPGYLRPLIPLAAYVPPGAFSADRTGRFFVSPPAETENSDASGLRDHCTHEIPATALHEGYPGHHLHFLTAHGSPRLARRLLFTPVTVEGWALYCEDMMGEEGFYRSAPERLCQRAALLWRALRVVLDVGLHTGQVSFADGVRMIEQRLHYSRAHAEAEVRRTCATPAYQLAYAVGRRELKALRDDFRRAAGADYTARRFHEAVLGYGGLPVSLMRWGLGLGG